MESLRDIKQQIKAINSTKQMMLTMKMVSSARIRSAQQTMLNGRPFAQKMASLIDNLRKDIQNPKNPFRETSYYRFFNAELGDKNKVGLILITGDKGLCGAFNAVTLRESLKWIRENKEKEKFIFVIGKKGADFLRRIKMDNLHIVCELINVFPHISYAHASLIKEKLEKCTIGENLSRVDLIYNNFRTVASQELVNKTFLPFDFNEIEGEEDLQDFIFEPNMMEVLLTLLPRYIGANIYRFLLESQAAELAARMNAMESAANNAQEIADNLSVKLNKVRQEGITNEITEIVSGANALNS
ncbi:MAG: ATP synthase F1 subunit gamma [Elusimicrobiaceae bacterium]|nr:ATP synthase F1 subunit gamma [Elusimicrobiaceae bacterium]